MNSTRARRWGLSAALVTAVPERGPSMAQMLHEGWLEHGGWPELWKLDWDSPSMGACKSPSIQKPTDALDDRLPALRARRRHRGTLAARADVPARPQNDQPLISASPLRLTAHSRTGSVTADTASAPRRTSSSSGMRSLAHLGPLVAFRFESSSAISCRTASPAAWAPLVTLHNPSHLREFAEGCTCVAVP